MIGRTYEIDGADPRTMTVGSHTIRVWQSSGGVLLLGAVDVSLALDHLPDAYRRQVPAEHRGLVKVAHRAAAVLTIPGVEAYASKCRRGARAWRLLDAMNQVLDVPLVELDALRRVREQRHCTDCRRRGLPRFCEPCRASRCKSRFKLDDPQGRK